MKNICNVEECTGCMACANVCAHNAIQFKADKEGFVRPVINKNYVWIVPCVLRLAPSIILQ